MILNHNTETVPASLLRASVPRQNTPESLELIARAAKRKGMITKSGLMVGLGESAEEVLEVMRDLRGSRVRNPHDRAVPPADEGASTRATGTSIPTNLPCIANRRAWRWDPARGVGPSRPQLLSCGRRKRGT